MKLRLHNYFRSSTSTRLRIALNLKGLEYGYLSYALRDNAHRAPEFLKLNPSGLVPALEIEDGGETQVLTQSLAIMEWLEETHPEPALLPSDAAGRARVRSLSYMIACEIHPLNNLRVLNYIGAEIGADEAGKKSWFTHWVVETFDAMEASLASDPATGKFCHGDTVTFADLCLYAQVWNNRRFEIALDKWPTINRIFTALDAMPAFRKAAPPNQPDAA